MRYYIFTIANLLAAFGGGTILSSGIRVFPEKSFFLENGMVLAMFVGAVLGLVSIQFVPKKWSRFIGAWFSFAGSFFSLILWALFTVYSANQKTLVGPVTYFFFALLCLRFGFWFYSRVLRAGTAAAKRQGIAWVEFGYYGGIALGIIIWTFTGIKIALGLALIIDAALQIIAGILDIFAYGEKAESPNESEVKETPSPGVNTQIPAVKGPSFDYGWYWRMAIALTLFGIGIQSVIFSFPRHASDGFGQYILACFYISTAIGAYISKSLKPKLSWGAGQDKITGTVSISYEKVKFGPARSFAALSIAGYLSLMVAILGLEWGDWGGVASTSYQFAPKNLLLLFFVAVSVFIGEILVLSLLTRIGSDENEHGAGGMIVKVYGILAIGVAMWIAVLAITGSTFWIVGLLTVAVCCIGAILVVWKRTEVSPANVVE